MGVKAWSNSVQERKELKIMETELLCMTETTLAGDQLKDAIIIVLKRKLKW